MYRHWLFLTVASSKSFHTFHLSTLSKLFWFHWSKERNEWRLLTIQYNAKLVTHKSFIINKFRLDAYNWIDQQNGEFCIIWKNGLIFHRSFLSRPRGFNDLLIKSHHDLLLFQQLVNHVVWRWFAQGNEILIHLSAMLFCFIPCFFFIYQLIFS